MIRGQEDFAGQMRGTVVEDHPNSAQKGEDEPCYIFEQTPRAIYTEQGPNKKRGDVTLSHAHSTPVACHEICKDLQLRGEAVYTID